MNRRPPRLHSPFHRIAREACRTGASLAMGVFSVLALPASAQLAAYEPFDLSAADASNPIGAAGGSSFGFSAAGWGFSFGQATVSFDAAGLDYVDANGDALDTEPGAVSLSGAVVDTRWSRALSSQYAARPDAYFVSFLLRLDSSAAGDAFWSPDGAWDKGAVGLQGSPMLRFVNGSSSGAGLATGQTVLLVVGIQRDDDDGTIGDGDEDRAELWVNPDLAAPGTPDAVFQTGAVATNRIRDAVSALFKFNGANAGAYTIDELRMGASFADVTPHDGAGSGGGGEGVGFEPDYPAHCQQDLQDWLPYPAKAELMVVTAHPDDEGIFFGGTLPLYTQVEGRSAILIGMTGSESNHAGFNRREELERAAWHYGVQHEPINFGYPNVNSNVAAAWEPVSGLDGVARRLATEIRRFRPDVMVTHDFDGEYGHAEHRFTADAVAAAYDVAADAAIDLEGLSAWTVPKLYIHLYDAPGGTDVVPTPRVGPGAFVHHDWEALHPELGGVSSRTIALEGLECHQDAVRAFGHVPVVSRHVQGELFDGHHAEDWGLYRTTVGPDLVPDDFFQNVPEPAFGSLIAFGAGWLGFQGRARRR